jgi:hypothetical protein
MVQASQAVSRDCIAIGKSLLSTARRLTGNGGMPPALPRGDGMPRISFIDARDGIEHEPH